MPVTREEIEAIIRALKRRFNNLSAEELIKLAWDIAEEREEVSKLKTIARKISDTEETSTEMFP